jgi:hypothetical protein
MDDIPADPHRDLERRYDGPIPAQHLDTARARRHRRRGTLSVLESQLAQFLDAAERCQGDIEDLLADLEDRRLACPQREVSELQVQAMRARCEAHIGAAADAFRQAAPLRRELGLRPHPLAALLRLLAEGESDFAPESQ